MKALPKKIPNSDKNQIQRIVILLIVILLTPAIFVVLASQIQAQTEKDELLANIGTLQEPEHCILCGYDMKYHAPVIVNLSTGDTIELQIYDAHPTIAAEVVPSKVLDVVHYYQKAGLSAIGSPSSQTCECTVPRCREKIDLSLYCRNCRELLTEVSISGYVLADLYELKSIKAYPIVKGAVYDIRIYTVSISKNETTTGLRVTAKGHLDA